METRKTMNLHKSEFDSKRSEAYRMRCPSIQTAVSRSIAENRHTFESANKETTTLNHDEQSADEEAMQKSAMGGT